MEGVLGRGHWKGSMEGGSPWISIFTAKTKGRGGLRRNDREKLGIGRRQIMDMGGF